MQLQTRLITVTLSVLASAALLTAAAASEDDYFGKGKPTAKPKPKPAIQAQPAPKPAAIPAPVVAALPVSDYHGLTAALSTAKSEYVPGEPILVSTTVKCSWEAQRLFNPFLNPSMEQPARIRVFNDGGSVVLEFLGRGSQAASGDAGWIQVYAGCSVGAEIALRPSSSGSRETLSPGTYRLQLVLLDTILNGVSKDQSEPKVIAVSSLVPIRVVGK